MAFHAQLIIMISFLQWNHYTDHLNEKSQLENLGCVPLKKDPYTPNIVGLFQRFQIIPGLPDNK